MQYSVGDWMSSPVVVIPAEMAVSHALTLMRRRGIHSLVVDISGGEEHEYGIITTSDIRDKIVAEGRDSSEVIVADIMSAPIVSALPEWSLRDAANTMQELGIHHLPVEDDRGNLVGMISATDIFIAVEEAGWKPIS